MSLIFSADLSTSALTDWTVEQHVPDGYEDFAIRGGKLVLLDAGNRIIPNIPALESFTLRGGFEADWGINRGECSLRIHFAYDPHRRQGLCLEFGSQGTGGFARLTSPRGELIAQASTEEVVENGEVQFEVHLEGGELALCLNSREVLTAALGQDRRGLVALSRGAFLGELRLRSLSIESDDPIEEESIWRDLRIPFAPINGMDIPIVWTVNAVRVGDAARVEVELSGGEKTRADVPWFPYHGHYVEVLDRPYLRENGRLRPATWPEVFNKICAAPTVMTPGNVQPGKGIGRSWAPVAKTRKSASIHAAFPSRVVNARGPDSTCQTWVPGSYAAPLARNFSTTASPSV